MKAHRTRSRRAPESAATKNVLPSTFSMANTLHLPSKASRTTASTPALVTPSLQGRATENPFISIHQWVYPRSASSTKNSGMPSTIPLYSPASSACEGGRAPHAAKKVKKQEPTVRAIRIASAIVPRHSALCAREPASDDIVHAYTRRQAHADGVLVDVTRQASPAEMHGGFLVPVAVTAALWAAIEAIPPSLAGIADPRGRLHDVLWMAGLAVRRASPGFAVALPIAGARKRTQRLRVDVGPDDDGAPCVTIGFPEDF